MFRSADSYLGDGVAEYEVLYVHYLNANKYLKSKSTVTLKIPP